jgi:hypothetical protein
MLHALAMNEQRYAPNIKNVVAIDEYGDRGDENIGEILRFLPGVALNDSGQVPNEVTLRGFPANTSGVTIDGGAVMGARGGATRALSLLEVPMSNVSRGETRRGAVGVSVANGIPAGTFNYQDARTRWGLSAQYSLTKRFAVYGVMTDLNGGFNPTNLNYGPGTPDYAKAQRYQELGASITIGVKGQF